LNKEELTPDQQDEQDGYPVNPVNPVKMNFEENG
jgi:hypothetical protein